MGLKRSHLTYLFIFIFYSVIFGHYYLTYLEAVKSKVDIFEKTFETSFSLLIYDGLNDLEILNEESLTEESLLRFANFNPQYAQVRILSSTGMELLRINQDGKKAILVPQKDLQDKSSRYYFKELKETKRELYISHLDLNVEHGKVEKNNITLRLGRRLSDGRFLLFNLSSAYFNKLTKWNEGVRFIPLERDDVIVQGNPFLILSPYTDREFLGKLEMPNIENWLTRYDLDRSRVKIGVGLDLKSERKKIFIIGVSLFVAMILSLLGYKQFLVYKGRTEGMFGLYQKFIDQSFIFSMTDLRGKITYVNDLFCKISGFSEAELIGKDHRIINSQYHDKEFMRDMWETLKRGEVFTGEFCNQKKNGELYWVRSILGPIFDESNRITGYAAVRYDITEKKKLGQELADSLKEREFFQSAMMANIGRMSATLSHQFSTPISVLTTSTDLLEDEIVQVTGDEYQKHDFAIFFKNMRETLNEMVTLTSFIKQLSRASTGETFDNSEVCNLGDAISHALTLGAMKKDSYKFKLTYDDVLFQHEVHGNDLLYSQVFLNLLNNSDYELRKMATGEERWVIISCEKREDEIKVFFTDSGRTPPEEVRKRIFDPYFSTKDLSVGSGLGLPIAREILERYNGSIDLDPKALNTTFVLTFKIV